MIMEKVIQNNNKIAYIVLSGNYHRKVYYTAKSTNNVLITTTQTQYFGTYIADDDMSAGVLEGMSGTYSSTSPYEDGGYDGGSEWYTVGNDNNPLLNTMYEQNGYEWEVMLPNGQYYITAHTTQSQTTTTTSYTQSTCKTNQLYVLKSYSKTGIEVDITALTTNVSSKSTYSGTVGIYSVTSSSNRSYSLSDKTLIESYTTISSNYRDLFYDSLISSSSITTRYTSSSRSYYTYSRTNFFIRSLINSSIETQYKATSLSEYNNKSSTTFTTNRRYNGTVPKYNLSNTYPYISFTTTGNIWNITVGGHDNYSGTKVPKYGTSSSREEHCFMNYEGVVHTYSVGTSYTSMLSETTTFKSYVSSITY